MSASTPEQAPPAGSQPKAGRLESAWRAARILDDDAWRKVSHAGPFRSVRWLAVLGFFIGYWDVNGTPHALIGWMPVLIVAVIGFLPDTSSISFAGATWRAARHEADRAERASEEAERFAVYVVTGQSAGEIGGEAAQAAKLPAAEAEEALAQFTPEPGS
jgi:hypothetical protein